jgi:hypothetical protein
VTDLGWLLAGRGSPEVGPTNRPSSAASLFAHCAASGVRADANLAVSSNRGQRQTAACEIRRTYTLRILLGGRGLGGREGEREGGREGGSEGGRGLGMRTPR